jgi:hypothetical protein
MSFVKIDKTIVKERCLTAIQNLKNDKEEYIESIVKENMEGIFGFFCKTREEAIKNIKRESFHLSYMEADIRKLKKIIEASEMASTEHVYLDIEECSFFKRLEESDE